MHDAGSHLLGQRKISRCQGFFVHGFRFLPARPSRCHFFGLQFRRLAVKDVDGLDAHGQQRRRAVEKTHQMGHGVAVVVPKRHAVSLRRAVPHGGQELKGGQERINAHPLASQFLQIGLFGGSDVLEVAAHAGKLQVTLCSHSPAIPSRTQSHTR